MADQPESKRSKRLLVALMVSIAANGLLLGSHFLHRIQAAQAAAMIDELYEFERQALASDDVAEMIEYIRGYYPNGSKFGAGTHLDRMVESVRGKVLARLHAAGKQPPMRLLKQNAHPIE